MNSTLRPRIPPLALTSSRQISIAISAALPLPASGPVRLMPKPILSGCCASAAPASASPTNRAPSTRLKVFRTLLPSMVPPRFSLSGDYESALLFVKQYPLPQALAALDLGEHLDLEFPRPEAKALARELVEERAIGLQAGFAHPREQRLVRVAPGRAQDIGGFRSPANRNDQHAEAIRLEFLRKGAFLLQPAADEVPARVDRPAFVDAAAALSAEVARLARLHLVAEDRALHPAVAAGRAGAALPRSVLHGDRFDPYHRAAAPLVFLSAAARARIVSSDGHRKSLAHALDFPKRTAMSVYFVILLSVLSSIAYRGSKVLVSLEALQLGANSFMVGVLAALYAVFPLLLAVYAGRISDRIGVRYPILLGSIGITAGLVLPALHDGLIMLFLCPTLIGLGHIFFHVSIHNAVGSICGAAERAKNFRTFSLGASVATFIGPSLAGFSIDALGFRPTFVALAGISVVVVLLALAFPRMVPPRGEAHDEKHKRRALDLLKEAPLRRTLIMSGVTLTGIELFSFYMPVYG